MSKKIGIVGLGLIGGSLAKSIKKNIDANIYAHDKNDNVLAQAQREGVVDGSLDPLTLGQCDIIILALYPRQSINYIIDNLSFLKKGCYIVDCVGVKTSICAKLSKLCVDAGHYFVGGHPMAGKETSGYSFSEASLFENATMILCRDAYTDSKALEELQGFFLQLGFARISISSPQEHDAIIAFTSQLAHVVSNAYMQSEQAQFQGGFSAGSYKDLTRVAYLNEEMWAELFIENKEALVKEVRSLAQRMQKYADLIEEENYVELKQNLKKGKEAKEFFG